MDLISQIINAKKDDTALPIEKVLTELIKYDKLSKSKKFQHIVDSPLLQKQLPYCWSAFNHNAQAYWLINEAAIILQNLVNYQLQILLDLNTQYSKHDRKQLELLGNINHHQFIYTDILSFPTKVDITNVLTITEKTDNPQIISISIIDLDNIKQTTIYHGLVNMTQAKVQKQQLIPEFVYQNGDDYVKITLFSNQGNNDFNFAKTKNFSISMPKQNIIEYKLISQNNIYWSSKVMISETDERLLRFNTENLDVVAKIIADNQPNIPEIVLTQYNRVKLLDIMKTKAKNASIKMKEDENEDI